MNEKFEIAVIVDTNDADYATAINIITADDLAKLRPIFKAIKNFKSYKNKQHNHSNNWPNGECLRADLGEKSPAEIYNIDEELVETVEEFCPANEWGFHTIERVEVYPVLEKERLV